MAKSNFEADCPCTTCGTYGEGLVCFHHILTQKAHPEFKHCDWNQLPLCLICHNKIHSMPLSQFVEKNPVLRKWLIDHEWELCTFSNKWRH